MLNTSNAFSNTIYMNLKMNPFDREFQLANKTNYSRYAHSISNINPNSPLNTPSIPIDGPPLDSAITTSQIISSIINVEESGLKISKDSNNNNNSTGGNNDCANDKRSNVVSVICHPGFRSCNETFGKLEVRSAPILLESNHEETSDNEPDQQSIDLSKNNSSDSFPSKIDSTVPKSLTNLVKILPKPTTQVTNSANILSSLSCSKRREKSFEEMVIEIKEREAALPPKARPGRKSKSTNGGENYREEKRRLSLERNRAAAMRCRLKKKKEIDDLKSKVDKYEGQNKELRVRTHGLAKFSN